MIEPARLELDPDDPLTTLRAGVVAALNGMASRFEFPNSFGGINAIDLNALNTLLGAGIEVEVVKALNGMREVWDADRRWSEYSFERSSQTFPDVRLTKSAAGVRPEPVIGVELKGWFLFAKEGVPSLRFKAAPAACAAHDLICVVPWYLSNAVSGVPEITTPWIESARYAAEWRDHWWTTIRSAKSGTDTSVAYPPDAAPYPAKADIVSAVPAYDRGDNYGRLPRSRPLMDAFIEQSMSFEVLGIPVRSWVGFLKAHTDRAEASEIERALERLLRNRGALVDNADIEELFAALRVVAKICRQ